MATVKISGGSASGNTSSSTSCNSTNASPSKHSSTGTRKRQRETLPSASDISGGIQSSEIPAILVNGALETPVKLQTAQAKHVDISPTTNGMPPLKMPTNTTSGSTIIEPMTIRRPAPFYHDAEAIIERERCDYTQKITKQMAKNCQAPRKIRVYADGIYDMFHQGHARQLMQAKNVFPNVYLLVGVCSDSLTHKRKGRTVMNDRERYEAVRHCRYVDEIVTEAPWELDDAFIEKHKIDFVAHDEIPYGNDDCNDIYGPLKARGMFVATERTEGVSTSDIVARIVKDYDIYVRRNLARGYSAKDLNVSFLSEKKFRLQNKMDELRDKGKKVIDEVKGDIITKWEEKSRDFIEAFLLLFGRERLSNIWHESKGRLMQAFSPPGSPAGSVDGDDEDRDDGPEEDDNDDDGNHGDNNYHDSVNAEPNSPDSLLDSPPVKRAATKQSLHKKVVNLSDSEDDRLTH